MRAPARGRSQAWSADPESKAMRQRPALARLECVLDAKAIGDEARAGSNSTLAELRPTNAAAKDERVSLDPRVAELDAGGRLDPAVAQHRDFSGGAHIDEWAHRGPDHRERASGLRPDGQASRRWNARSGRRRVRPPDVAHRGAEVEEPRVLSDAHISENGERTLSARDLLRDFSRGADAQAVKDLRHADRRGGAGCRQVALLRETRGRERRGCLSVERHPLRADADPAIVERH